MTARMNLSTSMAHQEPTSFGLLPLGWPGGEELFGGDGINYLVDGFLATDGMGGNQNGNDRNAILAELYRKEGASFLRRLRGSFAIALWDAKNRRLLLATDHFGTRPLYYWEGVNRLAFAPKIAFLAQASDVPHRIDSNSVYFYLNHSAIPAPSTIYKDIKRLEPGQYLLWDNGKVSLSSYWDMSYPEDLTMNETEAAVLLRSSVEESIQFLLRQETRPLSEVGAFLSGGTDSSTVVGLMSRITGERIHSFSVGFEEAAYNEIHYARIAASHFDSKATEVFVQPEQALAALPQIAQVFDEPFGNSSAIPTYFCVKAAQEAGVKVMFSGDGGDELYGGNERYLTEKLFWYYQNIPAWLRRGTDLAAEFLPAIYPWRKLKNYVRKANLPAADRFFSYQLYFRDHSNEFFTDDFRETLDKDFPLAIPRQHYKRAGDVSPLNRLLYIDLKLAIADNDLFKVNRMAECHGLQVRYPYLDHKVALASGMIPAALKLKGWTKRYVFKKAFAELLPQEILRKKKHGFGLPTGDWLRNHKGFRDLARALLLDSRSIQRGYFKKTALEALLRQHEQESSSYYGSHIWNFLMLELWHRQHYDQR